MRLGIFTVVFGSLTLDQVIAQIQKLGISTVELGTGGYHGDPHCGLDMLENTAARGDFQKKISDHGLSISALSCHGNPLHPVREIRERFVSTSRRTILLAEKLGVKTVIDFSGCPGDSDAAKFPNWVTCPWPPDFAGLLKWQWEEKAAPFWIEQAKFARDHGVRIAIEMHPGFLVYSPENMLRLRERAGETVGCNLDPSHLFWQGIDPLAAIRQLGSAIFHVHAKDTMLWQGNINKSGVLDTKPYTDELNRAWIFRTVGYGHGVEWWNSFVSTLRLVGYDDVLSIEHEDSLMSIEEGVAKAAAFLHGVLLKEKPAKPWWA
ncbi:MAG: sugar phosphate isomerase/epimerase family protein [Candidatus Acidiferrales bacterium]